MTRGGPPKEKKFHRKAHWRLRSLEFISGVNLNVDAVLSFQHSQRMPIDWDASDEVLANHHNHLALAAAVEFAEKNPLPTSQQQLAVRETVW